MKPLKKTIYLLIELCIKYFVERNFKLFIKALLTLKEEVIKIDAQNLDIGLVDLIMDQDVLDWAESKAGKDPSEYDWEAATVIAADLQDILKNSKDEE